MNKAVLQGKARLKTPVSLYKGISSKFLGYSTIGDIFKQATDQKNEPIVSLSKQLFEAKNENASAYKTLKEKECPAFIIGKFSQKRDNCCEQYVSLLGFDIDHIADNFLLEATLNDLRKNPFIFAAFPSPSGQGLRFFVWADSTPQTHKAYYEAICADLSTFLKIPTDKALRAELKAQGKSKVEIDQIFQQTEIIDTGTNNLARIWFYSHVPKDLCCLNLDSQVFVIKDLQRPKKPPPQTIPFVQLEISENEWVKVALEKVSRQNIPSGRNNFVYSFACEMCQHGVPMEAALVECLAYAMPNDPNDPFTDVDIRKSVRSAYDRKTFGKYEPAQIEKYKRMINGSAAIAALPTPQHKASTPSNGRKPTDKKVNTLKSDSTGERADVLFPIVSPPTFDAIPVSLNGCRTKSLKIEKAEKGQLYTWTETDKKGNPVKSDISNFVMRPMYLLKHNRNPKRIFEAVNIYEERATLCIEVKKMAAVDPFKAEIEGKGNFVPKFNRPQFDALKEVVFYQESQAEEIDTLGWQPAHGVYSFANGIFDGEKFYQVDEFGIAHTPKGRFYIPAFSTVNENGAAEYANERKFRYESGSLNIGEWTEMICNAYGDNGKVGICFTIACLFRDIVFQSLDCFPMLFLFAPPQSGKSTYRDSFLSLFGEPQVPISLESSSSPKGFSRKLAQFSNALIVFEEYKNRINTSLIGMLKSVYDGIGYERAQMTNDNKTHATPVLSGCMIVGQEVPTKENALFTRVLMLEFGKQSWSAQEKAHLDRLKSVESEGLGNVLFQILRHRQSIEQGFKAAFEEVFQTLRKDPNIPQVADRHIKNAAGILAPFKLLAECENLPFTYTEALKIVAQRLKIQAEVMTRTNEVNQFWEAFHYLRSDQRLSIERHYKYGEEKGQKLLYLILNQVYPLYNEYMTKQGLNALEQETLLRYLKQQSYFVTPKQLDGGFKESKDCKKVSWNTRRAYLFKADGEPVIEDEN